MGLMKSVSDYPATLVTRSSLAAGLRALGLHSGDVVCAHVSLKRVGFVIGGARTVIDGLRDAVGAEGTVMMPTYSGDLSDPAGWRHPPVPPQWIESIRSETPAYDPVRTPTRGMGVVPELFRHVPEARRSPHSQSSFAAVGPAACALVGEHPLDHRFGPTSPLGHLVELGGKVLLLGAPFDTTALFHLTQHLVGRARPVRMHAPMQVEGEPLWVAYDDIEYPHDWFDDGMKMLIERGIAQLGRVGTAHSLVLPAAEAVEAAVAWRKQTNR